MDRRLTPATERVAHVSLKGQIEAPAWTEGDKLRVQTNIIDLLRAPNGPRERQLVLGDAFTVIDRVGDHAFGFAVKDGYCGWLPEIALADGPEPTHWVASVGTHRYDEPRVQKAQFAVPTGAKVRLSGFDGKWAKVNLGYMPASHLRAIGDWFSDPVEVAEWFLRTPYLWGGNSRAGMDCSGLMQIAFAACGVALPADSDLQISVGTEVAGPLKRGDLIFWKGHVALIVGDGRILHANGFTMSVAYEGLDAAIERIAVAEGPVLARRRL